MKGNVSSCVIPAKAGIQHAASAACVSHTARGRSPLDPRFHRDDMGWKSLFFYALFFLVFVCFSSFAATSPAIDPAFCQALVKHVPDADVNYQPGIDVHGKPVVPADLPDSPQLQLPKTISIPLTADLFKTLNFSTDKYPFNTMPRNDINLGTLTVEGDRVLFNGKPLTSDQQDNLAVLCMKGTERKQPQKINPDKTTSKR